MAVFQGVAASLACCLSVSGLAAHQGYLQDEAPPAREEPAPAEDDGLTEARARFFDDRNAEQRLQNIGWDLATSNASFCAKRSLAIGLRVQDAEAFGNAPLIRRILGRYSDFTIRTVASNSPAHDAGVIPNQALLAIDGARLSDWKPDLKRRWSRYEQAHDAIEQSLAHNGEVVLEFEGDVVRTIKGVPVCNSRIEMEMSSDVALADGMRVRFGRNFPAFGYPRDEFAAIVAHELAHNLLSHPQWLSEVGRKRKNIRLTEREADRLMPWLLANAGFEPEAAVRFMERWGPKHTGGLFRKRTHDGWDERVENIAAEIPLIKQALEEGGHADWSRLFRREIER